MKRKILSIILFIAIVMIAGWNIIKNNDSVSISDIALVNIEALAGGEDDFDLGWQSMSYNCYDRYGTYTGKQGRTCYLGGSASSCTSSGCS